MHICIIRTIIRSARTRYVVTVLCSTYTPADSGTSLPGAAEDMAHSSLRFGLGRFTTVAEVDYVVEKIVATVQRLRDMRSVHSFFLLTPNPRFLTRSASIVVHCGRWYRRVSISTPSIGRSIKSASRLSSPVVPGVDGLSILESHWNGIGGDVCFFPRRTHHHAPSNVQRMQCSLDLSPSFPGLEGEVKVQVTHTQLMPSHAHVFSTSIPRSFVPPQFSIVAHSSPLFSFLLVIIRRITSIHALVLLLVYV